MTGTEVFNLTMGLIDSVSKTGVIEPSDYLGKTLLLLTVIVSEIAHLEGIADTDDIITDLSQELIISDKACKLVAPFGLATQFMLADKDDSYPYFRDRYEQLKKKIRKPAVAVAIIDVYGGDEV